MNVKNNNMQKTTERSAFSCLLSVPPELSSLRLRKSLVVLENKPQNLVCKISTQYRALKKPILGFKEGLYFIHKLCHEKIKKNYTEKPLRVVPMKKSTPDQSIIIPKKVEVVVRSHTPLMNRPETHVKIVPKQPKVVICQNMHRRLTKKANTAQKKRKEPCDIDGWNTESFSYNI